MKEIEFKIHPELMKMLLTRYPVTIEHIDVRYSFQLEVSLDEMEKMIKDQREFERLAKRGS